MRYRLLSSVLAICMATVTFADITITLKNEFIKTYMSRVTIQGSYQIDRAHKQPNSGKDDGDLHVAGRSDSFGLATVGEIMNARDSRAALQAVKTHVGGDPIDISGVWRIWCEHGGSTRHVQGSPLSPFTTTNPDHVFEVHPILKLGGIDLMDTLHVIPGFKEKDAEQAFTNYEKTPCHITAGDDTVTIRTVMAGYNYVKFRILPDKAHQANVEDGTFVSAEVQSLNGDRLVSKLYMAFPKGSSAEKKLRSLKAGKTMTVLGIPRISLARVWWRVTHASERPGDLDWSLPYEMVIVATY